MQSPPSKGGDLLRLNSRQEAGLDVCLNLHAAGNRFIVVHVGPASFYRRLDVHMSSPLLDCRDNIAAPLGKTLPV